MTPQQRMIQVLAGDAPRRGYCGELLAFSTGRGDRILYDDLGHWFRDKRNRDLRVPMIAASKGTSLINRALDATAMIYDQPAQRHVTDRDASFQAALEQCAADDVARGLDRALHLYEDCLIVPRVVDDDLRLELVTPDAFAAIPRDGDPTVLEAIAVAIPSPLQPDPDRPVWRIYTRTESYAINGKGDIIGPREPNIIGEKWQVLLCSAMPSTVRGCLLSPQPSADLLSAEKAQQLLTIFAMKEAKSAVRQLVLSGDTSSTAMGQLSDSEGEVVLGEGVTATSVDRGTDFAPYSDLSARVIDDCLAGRGIAPSVSRLADATSGAALWARRIPLVEQRRKRIPLLRRIEQRLWQMVSDILNAIDHEHAFGMAGFVVDFVEPAEPLSEMESLQVFREKRALFLQDTLSELVARNPDLDVDAAKEELRVIVERETARVGLTQKLQAMNGSTGSTAESLLPQDNGAMGAATLMAEKKTA